MLVVMGGAVAFIVFSILQPIMDLGQLVRPEVKETPHVDRRSESPRPFRRAQRGMTLLEIMIVLAILALVMGLVVGPRVMRCSASRRSTSRG